MKQPLLLILALGLFILTGCHKKETPIAGLKMLEGGKVFAVPTGTIADQFVLKRFPDAHIKYYNNVLDCALSVKDGKADAACYDQPILKNIAGKNEGVTVLSELLVGDQYGFAVQLSDTKLKSAIDSVLSALKADGTYKDMMKRWFPDHGVPAPMPDLVTKSNNGSNGVLKFGTAAVTEPMSFFDSNHKITGFDIEFATRVAAFLGKKLEISDMDFGAMLPALISGKVDMIGAGISITEERAKKVLFSQSYYPSGIAALVKSNPEKVSSSQPLKLGTPEDIKDRKIGVLLGSIHDTYANRDFPGSHILTFQNVPDIITALKSKKIDVAFSDHIALKDIFGKNPDLDIFAANIYTVPIAAAFNKENNTLREKFNVFLKEIRSNGVYDDMVNRWMIKGESEMPEIKTNSKNGPLRVGVVGDGGLPSSIRQNGKLVGFDIELPARFAAWLGMSFEPVDIPFGSMLASISTNKIDIVTCQLMITEERKKQVLFSDPYYESGISLYARKDQIATSQKKKLTVLEDIADKRIGVFTGTVHDVFVSKKYPKAQIFRFDGSTDLIAALSGDKIDVAMFDNANAKLIMKRNKDLGLLTDDVFSLPLGVGFNKNNPGLRDEFNNFLREIKKDGTYDKIYKRWFEEDAEVAVMPKFKVQPTGKKLILGTSVNDLPHVSLMNGEYVGFDIEMIQTFAQRNGYDIEFTSMLFPSLIPALASGKVDLISAGIAITEERAKKINFSDSFCDFKTALIATKNNLSSVSSTNDVKEGKKSFLKTVSESFHNNIILEKRYLLIIDGLKLTILIALLAAVVGTIIGGLVCYLRMSKRKILSLTARFYISVLRGTPVLVLLMIIYYVVFASVNINPALVAVFAFGLNFGAYVSEMFRTSIESIDRGQKEAGIAGGFTKIQTFIYIIMPQAIRQVLPVYKGEFISLVKMTSIVGYIAVQDLTKASDIIRSRTFDAFFPLIMAAVLYLVIAWLLTWALDYVEITVDPKRSRLANLRKIKK